MQPFSRWLRPVRPAEPPATPAEDSHARLLAEVERAREQVARRIDGVNALTETEVLACGRVLSTIVDEVRDIIADANASLEAALARSDESTARFIEEMQADIAAQAGAVREVLKLADGMEKSIEAIAHHSRYSNLIAINSRIEAARIGALGAGFSVIAEHIRDLSKGILESTERVGKSIEEMRGGLPRVSQRADSMQQRARSFIALMGEQVKTSGAKAGERLEAVMKLSNEALSHLQFQDPAACEIAAINRDLERLAGRLNRLVAGESQLEPVEVEEAAHAADRPSPGMITLFAPDSP